MMNIKPIETLCDLYCNSWNKELTEQMDKMSETIEKYVGKEIFREEFDWLLSSCVVKAELQGFQKGMECMLDLLKKC